MAKAAIMLSEQDVRARAQISFDRNWRSWAAVRIRGAEESPSLSVDLHPPREADLQSGDSLKAARAWVASWRTCPLPGLEWQNRSWARVGNQQVPVRVRLAGVEEIALWADRLDLWEKACARLGDINAHLSGPWGEIANRRCDAVTRDNAAPQSDSSESLDAATEKAVRTSIAAWCALSDSDWENALRVWDWLFLHPHEKRYVRQLPIRGIDTKWVEEHGKALHALHQALAGGDFSFAQPEKQFRCKALCPEMRLAGCEEFALSASQLARLEHPPRTLVICENLVNTLCLADVPNALALHGSGFAVTELAVVPWLARVRILYWGDLDSHGFAILDTLRSFAPHAESVMMDTLTLHRYFDLCVEEPKPATGALSRLTASETEARALLAQGDSSRGLENLRLEQERIEWDWAVKRIVSDRCH